MHQRKGSSPRKRESRPAGDVGRLPTICQLAGDGSENSITTQRAQFLIARRPMPFALAATIAALAWGGVRG